MSSKGLLSIKTIIKLQSLLLKDLKLDMPRSSGSLEYSKKHKERCSNIIFENQNLHFRFPSHNPSPQHSTLNNHHIPQRNATGDGLV